MNVPNPRSINTGVTWRVRTISYIRKIETYNFRGVPQPIFLPSIPRPMTWCNTPEASNLANLGITCNFHF
jgi:hypothetical protein